MKTIATARGQTFVLPVAHEFVASWSVYFRTVWTQSLWV